MYQLIDDPDALVSQWEMFEGQKPFPEWQYIRPDAVSPGNLEWPSSYLTRGTSPGSSYDQSTKNQASPPTREVTPGSPGSTSTTNKEEAYSRRLSQNRKAQRAHRARQKQHIECLEEKLKTVVSKYEDLQQRYSSLIASYERLAKEKGRNEIGKSDGEQSRSFPNWTCDTVHVTTPIWRQDNDQFVLTNGWNQWDDRGRFW